MKVLITSGAGYLGTELSYMLASQVNVDKVIIYDNLSRNNYNAFIGISKFFPNKVEFIEGDILDTRKLKKVIQTRKMNSFKRSPPEQTAVVTNAVFWRQLEHYRALASRRLGFAKRRLLLF